MDPISMICETGRCTGCFACAASCPVHAIRCATDRHGFYVPEIQPERCIGCGICRKVCPANHAVAPTSPLRKVLACWSKDSHLRSASSSGGIFTILAQEFIKKGGVVFGARFDDSLKVVHAAAQRIEELSAFQGSKYVQSFTGNTFPEVKKFLEDGRPVLFGGTPCQVFGLQCFLEHPYENLLTADLVCHGVPSPMVFQDYLKWVERTRGGPVTSANFRCKEPSWTIFSMQLGLSDGRVYRADVNHDLFLRGFLQNYFLRECCFHCPFAGPNRVGDLTLGDFWGYLSEKKEYRNDEKGISLVILNTLNGKLQFQAISEMLLFRPETMQRAQAGNRCLSRPFSANSQSENFWTIYERDGFFAAGDRYFKVTHPLLKTRIHRFVNNRLYWVPSEMQLGVLALLGRFSGNP